MPYMHQLMSCHHTEQLQTEKTQMPHQFNVISHTKPSHTRYEDTNIMYASA